MSPSGPLAKPWQPPLLYGAWDMRGRSAAGWSAQFVALQLGRATWSAELTTGTAVLSA